MIKKRVEYLGIGEKVCLGYNFLVITVKYVLSRDFFYNGELGIDELDRM